MRAFEKIKDGSTINCGPSDTEQAYAEDIPAVMPGVDLPDGNGRPSVHFHDMATIDYMSHVNEQVRILKKSIHTVIGTLSDVLNILNDQREMIRSLRDEVSRIEKVGPK